MADPLADLPNLGPKSAAMLRGAGISTPGQLRELGPVRAFERVRASGARPSLNLLYAIAGVLEGRRWNQLGEGRRAELLLQLDAAEDMRRRAVGIERPPG